jgi:hypothetical protein
VVNVSVKRKINHDDTKNTENESKRKCDKTPQSLLSSSLWVSWVSGCNAAGGANDSAKPSGLNMKPVLALLLSFALVPAARAQSGSDDADTFFELQVRPVLVTRCFKCHGGEKTSSGLRVDSREALLAGGERGAAIVPGDLEQSLLVQAIRHGDELKMPPEEALPAAEAAALETWVKAGAHWPAQVAGAERAFVAERHWAFEPVRTVAVPEDPSGWATSPIDRFILEKLRANNLRPQPLADREALLRRVSFDLVGLPPTLAELDEFLADRSPGAFEKVVERLLASPAYGERWGRHWMDIVRYADTAGDNADYPVPEARRYRDYIIAAFNNDKPFDEFVREQLAGDILARQNPARRDYAEVISATGFLALSRRYGTAPYELWHLTLEDTIDTTGRALLGLSLRCARCHDHKFDPVTSQDYYALYGIFASTQFPWAGGEELQSKNFDRLHFVSLASPDETEKRLAAQREEIAALEAEITRAETDDPQARRIAELDAQIATRAAASQGGGPSSPGTQSSLAPEASQAELAKLKEERTEASKKLQSKLDKIRRRVRLARKPGLPPDLPGAYAVAEGQAADVRVQRRGEPADAGDAAPRGVPKFLSGGKSFEIPAGASGRRQLAEWLTRADHPLTARVLVNRVWQHHFGKGLVGTPSNFGLRGESPTHPELLDWLTARFVEEGWSIKSLHRRIIDSKTYRLASGQDAANLAIDPGNRWYWRFDRRRLEAEAIRDALLATAGNLDRRQPSDHPFPPIAEWTWTQHSPFKAVYPSNQRSVYLMTQRLVRHPYLALFDGPDPNVSTDVRTSATVPLQALYLMNNPFIAEQAADFARRLLEAEPEARQRVRLAVRLAYGREPKAEECDRAIAFVEKYAAESEAAGAATTDTPRDAWTSFARVLLTANEFVYVD